MEARRIVLSRHARNRMRWHRVTPEEVGQTIVRPDFAESGYGRATRSWRRFRDGWLVVVHLREGDTIVVPTVIYSRTGPTETRWSEASDEDHV